MALDIFMLWKQGSSISGSGMGGTIQDRPNVQTRGPSRLMLKEKVATMARRTVAHLWVMPQLCPFLDWEALFAVSHALIFSHLDYCNASWIYCK